MVSEPSREQQIRTHDVGVLELEEILRTVLFHRRFERRPANARTSVRDLLLVAGQQDVELVVGRELKIGLHIEVVQPERIILQTLDIVRVVASRLEKTHHTAVNVLIAEAGPDPCAFPNDGAAGIDAGSS